MNSRLSNYEFFEKKATQDLPFAITTEAQNNKLSDGHLVFITDLNGKEESSVQAFRNLIEKFESGEYKLKKGRITWILASPEAYKQNREYIDLPLDEAFVNRPNSSQVETKRVLELRPFLNRNRQNLILVASLSGNVDKDDHSLVYLTEKVNLKNQKVDIENILKKPKDAAIGKFSVINTHALPVDFAGKPNFINEVEKLGTQILVFKVGDDQKSQTGLDIQDKTEKIIKYYFGLKKDSKIAGKPEKLGGLILITVLLLIILLLLLLCFFVPKYCPCKHQKSDFKLSKMSLQPASFDVESLTAPTLATKDLTELPKKNNQNNQKAGRNWTAGSGFLSGREFEMFKHKDTIYQFAVSLDNKALVRTSTNSSLFPAPEAFGTWQKDSSDLEIKHAISSTIFQDQIYQFVAGKDGLFYRKIQENETEDWQIVSESSQNLNITAKPSVVAFDGKIYIFFKAGGQIYETVSNDGKTWQNPVISSNWDTQTTLSSIVVDNQLQQYTVLDKTIYKRTIEAGKTWSDWQKESDEGSKIGVDADLQVGLLDRSKQSKNNSFVINNTSSKNPETLEEGNQKALAQDKNSPVLMQAYVNSDGQILTRTKQADSPSWQDFSGKTNLTKLSDFAHIDDKYYVLATGRDLKIYWTELEMG